MPPSGPSLSASSRSDVAAPVASGASDFAQKAHTNLQELVKAADAKATALITLQAIVFAIGGDEFLAALADAIRKIGRGPIIWVKLDIVFVVASVALAGAALASAVFAIWTLYPRSPSHIAPPRNAKGLMWISGLEPFSEPTEGLPPGTEPQSTDAFVALLRAMDDGARLADFAFEQLKISWILRRKFKALKRAMVWLVVALFAGGVTLVAWLAVGIKYAAK